jgi:hypothetical protein
MLLGTVHSTLPVSALTVDTIVLQLVVPLGENSNLTFVTSSATNSMSDFAPAK